jgi:chromosome segregation protein
VRGPAAIRRLLAHLHGARICRGEGAAGQPSGRRFDHHPGGERLGQGWLRVSRSGAAQQGALLREREINELREQVEQLQDREAELEEQLAGFREQLQAAEQQREDAQRALPGPSCGVRAGQLQGQQGKVRLHARIDRIEGELKQLQETLEANNEQAREAPLTVGECGQQHG